MDIMTHNDPILLVCDDRKRPMGAYAKKLLAAFADVPASAWSDQSEVGDRRTLVAAIKDGRTLVASMERATSDTHPDGLLTSISVISADARKTNPDVLSFEPLELLFDLDSMTGEDLCRTLARITIIDHEDLDSITGMAPDGERVSAFDRLADTIQTTLVPMLCE